MQKLQFESAWSKTVSPQDRDWINHRFTTYIKNEDRREGVHFSFLREAKNHKGELLVTVMIHNFDDKTLILKETIIAYSDDEQIFATGLFNVPCDIEGKTTMPWTFIFSPSNKTDQVPQYIIKILPNI